MFNLLNFQKQTNYLSDDRIVLNNRNLKASSIEYQQLSKNAKNKQQNQQTVSSNEPIGSHHPGIHSMVHHSLSEKQIVSATASQSQQHDLLQSNSQTHRISQPPFRSGRTSLHQINTYSTHAQSQQQQQQQQQQQVQQFAMFTYGSAADFQGQQTLREIKQTLRVQPATQKQLSSTVQNSQRLTRNRSADLHDYANAVQIEERDNYLSQLYSAAGPSSSGMNEISAATAFSSALFTNNAFGQFPTVTTKRLKKDRLASAHLNSQIIKKLVSRPGTTNPGNSSMSRANSSVNIMHFIDQNNNNNIAEHHHHRQQGTASQVGNQQSQSNEFVEQFQQPKNLLAQQLSISETQLQSKKFLTENRCRTAATTGMIQSSSSLNFNKNQFTPAASALHELKDYKSIIQSSSTLKQSIQKRGLRTNSAAQSEQQHHEQEQQQQQLQQEQEQDDEKEVQNQQDNFQEQQEREKRSEVTHYEKETQKKLQELKAKGILDELDTIDRLKGKFNVDVHKHIFKKDSNPLLFAARKSTASFHAAATATTSSNLTLATTSRSLAANKKGETIQIPNRKSSSKQSALVIGKQQRSKSLQQQQQPQVQQQDQEKQHLKNEQGLLSRVSIKKKQSIQNEGNISHNSNSISNNLIGQAEESGFLLKSSSIIQFAQLEPGSTKNTIITKRISYHNSPQQTPSNYNNNNTKDRLRIDLSKNIVFPLNSPSGGMKVSTPFSPAITGGGSASKRGRNSVPNTPHSMRSSSFGNTPRHLSFKSIKRSEINAFQPGVQQKSEKGSPTTVKEGLEVKSTGLKVTELEYIEKQRKKFLDDINPHFERVILENRDTDDAADANRFPETYLTFNKNQLQMTVDQLKEEAKRIAQREAEEAQERQLGRKSSQFAISNNRKNLGGKTANANRNANVVSKIHQQNIIGAEKRFYDHPQNMHDELVELGQELVDKFERYHVEDEFDFKRFQAKKEQFMYNFLNTNEETISAHELNLVKAEYAKHPIDRDYEYLDSISERLKFFKRFTKLTRIRLLKLAQIVEYPPGHIIFKEGEEGNLMFVIIRGACHVRILRLTPEGKEDNQVVATLYDGQQFGELALMNQKKVVSNEIDFKKLRVKDIMNYYAIQEAEEKAAKSNRLGRSAVSNKSSSNNTKVKGEKQGGQKPSEKVEDEGDEAEDQRTQKQKEEEELNRMLEEAQRVSSKRAATIETCEVTTLFTVSREFFKSVLFGLIQQELDLKLKMLLSLSFFEFLDPLSLIPLANLVEVKKFKLGEIVLREGEYPHSFFIVNAGRVKIIKEEIIVRNTALMGRAKKYPTKAMKFGRNDYQDVVPQGLHSIKKNNLVENEKREEMLDKFDFETDEAGPQKAANYEIIFEDESKFAYQYQNEFGAMVKGDSFFGRSILLEYLKIDPDAIVDYRSDPSENAKLTVVADSAEIEVYVIEKQQIHLIPHLLRRTMVDGLLSRKEYDSIYTKEVGNWTKQWDKYKSHILEEIHRENSNNKQNLYF